MIHGGVELFGATFVKGKNSVRTVYIKPVWLSSNEARRVALGEVGVEEVDRAAETDVEKLKKEAERLREVVKRQREEIVQLKSALKSSRLVSDVITGKAPPSEDVYKLIDDLKKQIDELRGKQVVLPPQLKMLSEDEKKVWLFLRQKGKAFKTDVRGYTVWGRRRVNNILNNLEKRRLIGRTGRKIFAKEPMV